jgi:hypothetical protein
MGTKSKRQIGKHLDSSSRQDRIMANYKRLGFVRDKRDEEGLHMGFSPMSVPEGLTKLQVRRRVNKYFTTPKSTNPFADIQKIMGHRLTILMDGRFFSGISVSSDVTKTPKTWVKFVEEYLRVLKAPRKPMPKGF